MLNNLIGNIYSLSELTSIMLEQGYNFDYTKEEIINMFNDGSLGFHNGENTCLTNIMNLEYEDATEKYLLDIEKIDVDSFESNLFNTKFEIFSIENI